MKKTQIKSGTSTDTHVGKQVRMRRKMLGLSQTALADQLGITFQQVQKYEKGANRISASRLQAIAKVLRVPVGALFESPTGKPAGNDAVLSGVNDFVATTDGLKLMRSFQRIPSPHLRRSLVELVAQMAEAQERQDN